MTDATPSPLDRAVDGAAFAHAIDAGLGRPILWVRRPQPVGQSPVGVQRLSN
jgi:hypothetical protein